MPTVNFDTKYNATQVSNALTLVESFTADLGATFGQLPRARQRALYQQSAKVRAVLRALRRINRNIESIDEEDR